MEVTIDKNSGFCYGVVRAIRMAEDELQKGNSLFALGDIVHNEPEVTRLNTYGMQTVSHTDLGNLHRSKILIRAHGEPPQTYEQVLKNNNSIVDATCPVVLKLQKKVHRAYLESLQDNGQVVIYGKPGHAEVNGLVGQTGDTAIVINSEHEMDRIDVSRPVYLFAQTTMTVEGLQRIREAIEQKRTEYGVSDTISFMINDTICRHVSNREPQLNEFARQHDVVIFVSGTKSSNGRALYEVCKRANDHTYMILTADDLNRLWFAGIQKVGVCGATSTPRWLMEEVADKVKRWTVDNI